MPEKLVVRDITKSFPTDNGRLKVVDGISFSVDEGKIVAIAGPSGCGKSTLMNVIAGFERPDSGSVLVDGSALRGPSPKGIVISQHGSVFPWLNVRQNLLFGLARESERDGIARSDHYLALVGLVGFERAYPHELSGGMLKRVEIARALMVKPEILYMDEPFSALDALLSMRMRNELLRILAADRHTVVLITHDVEEAIHLADQVLVLSARPTTIQARFEVPFPHPRKLTSPEAQALKESILGELGL
ncbi:MAG TPA: ABC transporter ATP-binding protein [Myxococcota bacterium]|nr:ABC transporter ATP-binding protein [Myxococcota bacterium]